MSDLISRCELFNRLATIPAPFEANEFKAKIYEVIQEMETADRPQGEWKIVPPNAWEFNGIIQWHECSVCKCRSMFISDYCPHCGAKMIDEDINVPNEQQNDCQWK